MGLNVRVCVHECNMRMCFVWVCKSTCECYSFVLSFHMYHIWGWICMHNSDYCVGDSCAEVYMGVCVSVWVCDVHRNSPNYICVCMYIVCSILCMCTVCAVHMCACMCVSVCVHISEFNRKRCWVTADLKRRAQTHSSIPLTQKGKSNMFNCEEFLKHRIVLENNRSEQM